MCKKCCYLCGKSGEVECPVCRQAWFCSQEHLEELHQPPKCFPIKVATSEAVGRHLVATRDLAPLDIVLGDTAAPSGPLHDSTAVCMTCYGPGSTVACPDCGLLFCSQICQEDVIHRRQECALFSERGIKFNMEGCHEHPLYKVILVLRLLLIHRSDPVKWKGIEPLMDHNSDRITKDRVTWDYLKKDVVDYILAELKMGDLFGEEEIQKCIGIIRINGINSSDYNGVKYRCLFPKMALLSNSCLCNCRCIHRDFGSKKGLEIRAQVPIKAGTELTIQYNSMLLGLRKRREMFRQVWFFDCKCERCSDATEMGSYLNGLVCQVCAQSRSRGEGRVLPQDPLDYDSLWACDQEGCRFTLSTSEVEAIEDEAERLIENGRGNGESHVEFYENLLDELSSRFHQSHYLLMKVKSNLISQYGNVPGFYYSQMDSEKIERKLSMCQEFLEVFGKVDPGNATDWWAVTQFEAIQTKSVLLQRDLDSGRMLLADFKTALIAECRKTLPDVTRVLEIEQTNSYLRQMAEKARKLQQEIDDIIRFADFL